eukprot:CAMPEP_0197507816 /NCGR_PEP_ID=MMETSP1312-20131121/20087_1 /TAXON_ID=464262 /ORGANISM="Genus nov. species nov., Strain RCC2335" /LENGTH=420 /DNA_ID=CAMNT_0043055465 /DNA_START=452 /DNA_END=1714 /DNA_ORIENTATION=+
MNCSGTLDHLPTSASAALESTSTTTTATTSSTTRCTFSRIRSAPSLLHEVATAAVAPSAAASTASTPQETTTTTKLPESSLIRSATLSSILKLSKDSYLPTKKSVIGHRGLGSNQGPDPASTDCLDGGCFAGGVRENTLLAFQMAAAQGADFVELDVQITKDGVPVDLARRLDPLQAPQRRRRRGDGHQDDQGADDRGVQADLLRGDGVPPEAGRADAKVQGQQRGVQALDLQEEDELPTLQEVLTRLPESVGLNIELKFEDEHTPVEEAEMRERIAATMKCIARHGRVSRKIVLSSFSPDACIIASKMNPIYPIMMLTDAGVITYDDERRNSLQAAQAIANEYKLSGVVLLSNILPTAETLRDFVRDGLLFMSYGEMNNDGKYSLEQLEMGIHGVIVDDVLSVSQHVAGSASLVRSAVA